MTKRENHNNSPSDHGTGLRAARNSLYLVCGQMASRFLGMAIAVWLTYYLGDTIFGRYIFIITIVGFARIASNFGMDQVLIRAVARDRQHAREYLGAGIVSRMGIFTAGFIPLLIFIAIINKPADLKQGLIIGYLAVAFISTNQTFDNVFNGFERFGFPAVVQFLAKIVQIAMIVLAMHLKLGLLWIVGTLVFSEMVRSILLWIASLRDWGMPVINREKVRDIVTQSLPFVAIMVLSMVQARSDVIILGLYCDDDVVGWYGAAINLMFAFLIVSSSASNALFPVFSRLSGADKKTKLVEAYRKSVKLLLILGLPVALSISMLSGRIIELLYPESFRPAALVLAITIWSIPIIFVNSTIIRIINAFHKEKTLLIIIIICASASIVTNIINVQRYAQLGAAVTNLFVATLSTVLCIIAVEKTVMKLKYPLKSLLKSIPALAALALCIIWLKQASLYLLIPAGVIIYTIGILLLRIIEPDELRLILNVFIPRKSIAANTNKGNQDDENS